ncbi:uncharacterized protein DS421_4g119260 [Arachis hypogaea]|nr:uncharacterized protein DS421_4g119260 [Arachis hypogaea]
MCEACGGDIRSSQIRILLGSSGSSKSNIENLGRTELLPESQDCPRVSPLRYNAYLNKKNMTTIKNLASTPKKKGDTIQKLGIKSGYTQ